MVFIEVTTTPEPVPATGLQPDGPWHIPAQYAPAPPRRTIARHRAVDMRHKTPAVGAQRYNSCGKRRGELDDTVQQAGAGGRPGPALGLRDSLGRRQLHGP